MHWVFLLEIYNIFKYNVSTNYKIFYSVYYVLLMFGLSFDWIIEVYIKCVIMINKINSGLLELDASGEKIVLMDARFWGEKRKWKCFVDNFLVAYFLSSRSKVIML